MPSVKNADELGRFFEGSFNGGMTRRMAAAPKISMHFDAVNDMPTAGMKLENTFNFGKPQTLAM
jgi:hypothetical protein